ncbi:MAG: hypothetical protein U0638_16480 [Phycisphaerales bacterium]
MWADAIAKVNEACHTPCEVSSPGYCIPHPPEYDPCEAAAAFIEEYNSRYEPDLTPEQECLVYQYMKCPSGDQCSPDDGGDRELPWVPGSPFAPPSLPWDMFNPNGDPYADTPKTGGGINLATGIFTGTEIDLALPAPGFSWTIGRCTIPNTIDEHDDYVVPTETVQGYNWFQLSLPKLTNFTNAVEFPDLEVLLVTYHTDGQLLFVQSEAGSDLYLPAGDFEAAIFKMTGQGSNEDKTIYRLVDKRGTTTEFFESGELWRITDASGNHAWRYHPDDPSLSGIGANKVVDSAGRLYHYEYSSSPIGGDLKELLSVTVKTKTGGEWYGTPENPTEIAKVTYDYYTSTETDQGMAGDLKTVTVSRKLSDTSLSDDRVRYYRYLTTGSTLALVHTLQMVVGEEGTRAYDWASDQIFNGSYAGSTVSLDALKPYAEKFLSYESLKKPRVHEYFMNGNCGCSSSSDGKYQLSYETNPGFSNTTNYDTGWRSRTLLKQPDGTWITIYFDELNKMMAKVVTDGDPDDETPPHFWMTVYKRDGMGRTTREHTPANITAYTHTPGSSSASIIYTASGSDGLIRNFEYYEGTELDGFLHATTFQAGTSGTASYEMTRYYFVRNYEVGRPSADDLNGTIVFTVSRPFLFSDWSYTYTTQVEDKSGDTAAPGSYETLTEYEFHSETSTSPLVLLPNLAARDRREQRSLWRYIRRVLPAS